MENKKKKKLPLVKCRICGRKDIDRNVEIEGIDWIMPSKNYFYHKKCYDDWKHSEPKKDEEWIHYIYDFLSRDLKVSYNWHMCENQRENFIKKNKFTNKGIFFSLKYFYEIKKGDWNKSNQGIGIVSYIYSEACNYWVAQERLKNGTCKKIEEQMRQARDRETKVIYHKKDKGNKKIDLSLIGEMEDE